MKWPSIPVVTGVSSLLGSARAFAQSDIPVAAAPSWLDPLIPAITSAALFGGGALIAWLLKTAIGSGIGVVVVVLRTRAKVLVERAQQTPSKHDDSAAHMQAAVLMEVAKRLEQSEKTIPFKSKDQE